MRTFLYLCSINLSSDTHSLCREHLVDGMVILLGQDGQLPGLFLLQPLKHGLVVRLGCGLKQVVPEGLVLPGLSFTCLLELFLNLKLLRLKNKEEKRMTMLTD